MHKKQIGFRTSISPRAGKAGHTMETEPARGSVIRGWVVTIMAETCI